MTGSIPVRKSDTITVDSFCADALGRAPAAPEIRYPTGMGPFTFAELVGKTQRIVGNLLRQSGMDNPDDIDDALQSGYLKLYARLQQDPELFAGKPKCYIVKNIYYRSKAQRYAQFRHYHKLVFDADPDWLSAEVGLSSPKADFRIDLAAALARVVAVFEASDRGQLKLLILYCLLTQAQPCEVAPLFASSSKTFTKHVREVRQLLQAYLPNYRPDRPQLAAVRERAQRSLAQPHSGDLVCDRYLTKPANRTINDLSGFEDYLDVTYDQALLQQIRAHERFAEIVAAIAGKVAHNWRLLLALYVETTSVTQRAVAELFDLGHHAFGRREGRLIRRMMAAEFQIVMAG